MDQIEKTRKVVTLCDFRAIKKLDSRLAYRGRVPLYKAGHYERSFSAKVVSLMQRLDKLSQDG